MLFLQNFSSCASKSIRFAGLALTAFLSIAMAASAAENAPGNVTVAEWRTNLRRSELATVAYAAGAMAMANLLIRCDNTRTVKELHAYLIERAQPSLTMKQAIQIFLIEANCVVTSEDGLISSHSSCKSTKDAGEY